MNCTVFIRTTKLKYVYVHTCKCINRLATVKGYKNSKTLNTPRFIPVLLASLASVYAGDEIECLTVFCLQRLTNLCELYTTL